MPPSLLRPTELTKHKHTHTHMQATWREDAEVPSFTEDVLYLPAVSWRSPPWPLCVSLMKAHVSSVIAWHQLKYTGSDNCLHMKFIYTHSYCVFALFRILITKLKLSVQEITPSIQKAFLHFLEIYRRDNRSVIRNYVKSVTDEHIPSLPVGKQTYFGFVINVWGICQENMWMRLGGCGFFWFDWCLVQNRPWGSRSVW